MEKREASDETALVSSSSTAATTAQVPPPGPTLLPAPFAKAISLATRSTGLVLRVGSVFGSYGLDAARFTTLSSLELTRGVVEGILVRAVNDSTTRPRSDYAASEAETILERSLETLHLAVNSAVFWTAAGFQFTGTTLLAAGELSKLLLSSLDQLFGSTDSSRAIASIVTLIRREFNNPVTGSKGEKVGVVDLVLALSALAYLQGRCWKALEEERKTQTQEEIIWDVVVVDDGERVDVHAGSAPTSPGCFEQRRLRDEPESPGGLSDTSSVRSISLRSESLDTRQDDEQVLAHLKKQISSSLAPGASVSMSSSVSTTQTITVDVHGPQSMTLPTPPGAEIVETQIGESRSANPQNQSADGAYRVVYKINRNKLRSTTFQRHDEPGSNVVELEDDYFSHPTSPTVTTPVISKKPLSPEPQPERQAWDLSRPTKASAQRAAIEPSPASKRVGGQTSPLTSPRANLEPTANQKKQRTPLKKSVSKGNIAKSKEDSAKKAAAKKKTENAELKSSEKKSGFKQALKGSGQSFSNIWNKEPASADAVSKLKPQWRTVGGSVDKGSLIKPKVPPLPRNPKVSHQRPNSRSSLYLDPELLPRSSSRASYVSVHDRRRDSIVSQTDAYAVRTSGEFLPASPSVMRTEMAAQESLSRQPPEGGLAAPSMGFRAHRRGGSHVPSLYSLATNDSQTSLILASYYQKSAYNGSNAMSTLRRAGAVEGTFPSGHLLQNISRYMRFSSASYGSNFLKVMGISNNMPSIQSRDETHNDIRHFVHHTESGEGNVLLASFVDPGGGSDGTGATDSGMPLVHYISLDHNSKAVVLACRGTLGFEDVLADLTCDYDRLTWRGRGFRVHKGVHASARRILYGGDGRVLITLQEALREFPEYGLVLCGHSLGGAVTSLLGVMLAEPNPHGPGFVTPPESQGRQLGNGGTKDSSCSDIRLPGGRPIHVFAYGPPGAMSATLCKMTKGLITTVVHGSDLVPHLSLGLLHDFQALALAFKKDDNQAKTELRQRMWQAFQSNVTDRFGVQGFSAPMPDDDRWMMPALKSMRETMHGEKLMPPGEVFCIETQRVLRRDAFVRAEEHHIGRPAQRIVLRYVKDVEARFGEVRFGTSMLLDHSPARYEASLNKLRLGVAE